jgi:hypothetical protein
MLTLAACLFVAFFSLVACENERASEEDALRAQEEANVQLYWLGESYDGLPLTEASAETEAGARRALFIYGECEGESEGIDDFHCTKPQIQVQHFPFDAVGWKIASGCRTLSSLRGVPTLRHDGLVLVTRDGIVKIYGRRKSEDARIALALQPLAKPQTKRLPAPTAAQREIVAAACP